jgi:hypothetical protein
MDLIKLNGNLESPRQSKPSDFPAVGPTGPEGMASGAGQLVKLTESQESPRSTQDGGDQTPSDWSKDTWKVGKSFSEAGTSVKAMCSVDFETGKHSC